MVNSFTLYKTGKKTISKILIVVQTVSESVVKIKGINLTGAT